MWPFFNNKYPYTDFHELNADWIISKIHQLEHTVISFSDKIKESVYSWLDEHPEATTTVQDRSISKIKLTNDLAREIDENKPLSNTLWGFSQGSVILDYDYAPSSFGIHENILYILCFSRTSDTGKCVEVNLDTNKILGEKSLYLAHANSCATVPNRNCHYVCPTHTYQGVNYELNKILKYDNTFSGYTEIATDYPFLGVSYDRATDTVYLYDRVSKRLCKLNENDVVETVGIINDIPDVSAYNQDIACYNDYLYLCGYKGEFVKVYIPTLEIVDYGNIMHEDGAGKYEYNEPEGWEFGSDGKLYQMMYSKFRNVQSFGIFAQIGTSESNVVMPRKDIADPGFTANIDVSSIDNFDNYESYFKHPNEVNIALEDFNTLSIMTDANFGTVILEKDTVFNNGLVCDDLIVRCANVFFDNVGAWPVSIGSIDQTARGCIFTFGGNNAQYHIGSYDAGSSGSTIIIKSGITFIDGNGDPDISAFDPIRFTNPTTFPVIIVNQKLIHNTIRVQLDTSQTIPANSYITKTYTLVPPSSANYDVVVKTLNEEKNIGIGCSRTQNANELKIYCRFFNESGSNVITGNIIGLLIPYETV